VLTETTLTELPLDALFELMLFKIDQIKLLRAQDADTPTLLAVVDDIMLIQKVIDEKKSSENPAVR
jgi:hypothetical protein